MRMVSWNVNGIRAAWNHGLSGFLQKDNADIYAFQEIKTNEPFFLAEIDGYEAYWNFCNSRKGYSGTLILTKQKPINVTYSFDDFDFDTEGRIITLEFENFYFINCYVPNSQSSARRRDYRAEWDRYLLQYILELKQHKSLIICGDFNVPISDKDIYDESNWQEWNAEGFQSEERDNLLNITNAGFVDTYRYIHPDKENSFTWWSNRLRKRDENKGWRLDYFFVSDDLCPFVTESDMLSDVYGSDHCPIYLDISMADTLFYPYAPVKTNLNPYIDIEYLESRTEERKIQSVTGIYRSIWNRQQGRCYYCGKPFQRDDDKKLVEIDNRKASLVKRMAYVHTRCMDSSFEYIDTETAPASLNELRDLLLKLDTPKNNTQKSFYALSEFFRTCNKTTLTLTFKQIEELMEDKLGNSALRKEFWYRTGLGMISQCWLDNGYTIKALHLDERKRVVFRLTGESKDTSSLNIPEVLKYQRIPNEAKYELENYFQYIIKKYGL